MPKRKARRLVVDASLARAAGGADAVYPTSKRCRDALIAIRDNGHEAVVSPDIATEWDEHQSAFARTWRVSMTARRRVRYLSLEHNDDLRSRIGSTAENVSRREAMLKDCHLLEAALASDNTVISLDETVRGLFSAAARTVGELRGIIWANPDRVEEAVESWLASGARPERRRLLRKPA